MKDSVVPGSTSKIRHVFIADSTSTTGAGKTALAFGDITAYYVRAGGTLTALTMETIATLGTWASSGDNYLGFKLMHDTNAPGIYELHLPNNILAAGSDYVLIQLRATGAAPVQLMIQLGNVPANTQAMKDGVVTAAALADAAIDNATFAADVGSTAYATNIIALAVQKALVQLNLDHLISGETPIDGKAWEAALRYALAVLAGKVSGAGTGTESFFGLDGVTERVRVSAETDGDRTAVSYDPI